jgi:hypothetical protein
MGRRYPKTVHIVLDQKDDFFLEKTEVLFTMENILYLY